MNVWKIKLYEKKLEEYYGRQKPQVHAKLHVQRSLILKLANLEK